MVRGFPNGNSAERLDDAKIILLKTALEEHGRRYAFDVTTAHVTGLITERGVLRLDCCALAGSFLSEHAFWAAANLAGLQVTACPPAPR
jgi:hypothetical protein